MNRRHFLSASAASVLPIFAQEKKPNIIFIFADDLGYGDVGCYGQKLIATPNIDKLAFDGIKFTQAYCGSTVCAPSRCALMTGFHMGHARIRGNARVDLKPEDITVAAVLKSAGYRTGIFGKWGLGTAGNSGVPNRQGFDEWYGFLDQKHAHTQYPTQLWANEEEVFLDGNFGPGRKDYAHDLFTDRGLKFIEQNKANPFFLYLAYTIPHANNELNKQTGDGMEVPDEGPYATKDWPKQDRKFAATVHRLDRDVGRVVDAVKKFGIDENTLIMFASDNGAHREGGNHPEFFKSSGPLRGIKRDLYDGGIRTPFIARWTGTIKPRQVSDAVFAFWDFLPTCADLAGVKAPAGIDGISFAPALRGHPVAAREYLYWEFHERGFSQAVRLGNWKGVRNGSRKNPIELYDIVKDPGESDNVAAQNAAIVKRIAEIMVAARTDSPIFPIREQS